ncbi:cytochrome-c peroxidase [Fortiea contorta]|uniref:cytochrome-c peroxidase n=1 Tax=Fortiea contorta TaxID=1892405 RepID=UPI000476C334|nr:cytochrome c peroxidase [Fortiea contorta]
MGILRRILSPRGRGWGFVNFTRKLKSKSSKTIAIALLVLVAIICGHTVSAQVTPTPALVSLKSVAVPEPDNLGDFIRDKTAAIKLGKTIFWDMQIGSDGVMTCASCHFHAGADSRSKNQINPGVERVNISDPVVLDATFQVGGGANYQLKPEDFPFRKLSNPDDANSTVLADSNDIVSSGAVFNTEFVDVVPGQAEDKVNQKDDPIFNVNGVKVRRVEPRNAPSVIDAVFNLRNFWDGRAQDTFNGVNLWGNRDPNAFVGKANNPNQLELVKVSLNNSSLASQALAPPISSFEMSADGRTFQEIGDKLVGNSRFRQAHQGIDIDEAERGRKLPRKMGKKLLAIRPLGKQIVHPEDSVLGADSRFPNPGLKTRTYDQLIKDAFKAEWWRSNLIVQVNTDGSRSVLRRPTTPLDTNQYSLIEYNFPLFFGLAVQAYEATLISDDTPYDRFVEGNPSALNEQQQRGLQAFQAKGCIGCHIGAEFTIASVNHIKTQGRIAAALFGQQPIEDVGFLNNGVRPTREDRGIGGSDPFGNPLAESRLALNGTYKQIVGEDPPVIPTGEDNIAVEGAFKVSALRNVELTAPYFHNGAQLTLEEVLDFYSRGGDFRDGDSPGVLPVLNLTAQEKTDIVAFLKGLTDERVRLEKAPFDHPQLFVPNGHPGDSTSVTDDGTGKATDEMLEIPAVGRNGGSGHPNFLATSTNR